MPQVNSYRYQLPKKAIKSDCPQCGPRHRNTLSRYVDTRTGELLPESYGRCDRESNCGYSLSPYQKTASGLSYADEVYQQWKENNPMQPQTNTLSKTVPRKETLLRPVCCIPDALFSQSLSHFDQNQFAQLLSQQFGQSKADELLQRFLIGTSARWPGACVFWYIDEQGRKRGGQIKLFGPDWHTANYIDHEGQKRSKTSWVHSVLTYRLKKSGTPLPDWLVEYNKNGECSPCLFGLPQLLTAPIDTPIAIVEAPKTAIVCTHYLPDFIWLAVGALSYLNAARLAPIRGRRIMLFPDLNAYDDRVNEQGKKVKGWLSRADELQANGFDIEVSGYLEQVASEEQKKKGFDLADFLLIPDDPRPRWIRAGQIIYGEVLKYEPCDNYPVELDTPNELDAVPTIKQQASALYFTMNK